MALWFCETVAREIVGTGDTELPWFQRNVYASPRDAERRHVVDIRDYQDAQLAGLNAVRL